MLEDQADGSNANPAAKAEDNRFASCFYQFHNVGIQSDGSHGNNNEKFAQFFDRSKKFCRYTEHICRYCCDDGSDNKIDNKDIYILK